MLISILYKKTLTKTTTAHITLNSHTFKPVATFTKTAKSQKYCNKI